MWITQYIESFDGLTQEATDIIDAGDKVWPESTNEAVRVGARLTQ